MDSAAQQQFVVISDQLQNLNTDSYELFAIFVSIATQKNIEAMQALTGQSKLHNSVECIKNMLTKPFLEQAKFGMDVERTFEEFERLSVEIGEPYDYSILTYSFNILTYTAGLVNTRYMQSDRHEIMSELKLILDSKIDYLICEQGFSRVDQVEKKALTQMTYGAVNVDLEWVLDLAQDQAIDRERKLDLIQKYGWNTCSMNMTSFPDAQ